MQSIMMRNPWQWATRWQEERVVCPRILADQESERTGPEADLLRSHKDWFPYSAFYFIHPGSSHPFKVLQLPETVKFAKDRVLTYR